MAMPPIRGLGIGNYAQRTMGVKVDTGPTCNASKTYGLYQFDGAIYSSRNKLLWLPIYSTEEMSVNS